MDTLPDRSRSSTGCGNIDDVLLRAVAEMPPGWTVLRDCALGSGDRGSRARVRYALLHRETGIALLDLLPRASTPDAPDRLRRSLDAAGFRVAFGGLPPVVHLRVPSRSLGSVRLFLAQEFSLLPPLALTGGEAWVDAARRVLAAEPPLRVPERLAAGRAPLPAPRPERGRAEGGPARRQSPGLRGLAAFWGAVAVAVGGGASSKEEALEGADRGAQDRP